MSSGSVQMFRVHLEDPCNDFFSWSCVDVAVYAASTSQSPTIHQVPSSVAAEYCEVIVQEISRKFTLVRFLHCHCFADRLKE